MVYQSITPMVQVDRSGLDPGVCHGTPLWLKTHRSLAHSSCGAQHTLMFAEGYKP